MSPAEPLALARVPQHPPDFGEPGVARQRRHAVDRPPVGRGHLVVEGGERVTLRFEEGEHEVAAGCEDPAELREVAAHVIGRGVDHRVPGHDAAQRAVGQVEGVHGADLEAQLRMPLPGDVDHHGRQVDPEDVEAQLPQVRGHRAGAAAELGDRSGSRDPRKLGERGEHRTVHRGSVDVVAVELGVDVGEGVVGSGGRLQVRRGLRRGLRRAVRRGVSHRRRP